MCVDDVSVETLQMATVTTKTLVRGSELQDLSDRAQVAPLIVRQRLAGAHVDDVKGVRRDDCRVDVAVVDQVADDLGVQ